MEWLDQFQRDLGAPVVGFLLQHWIVVLFVGAGLVYWLILGDMIFARRRRRRGIVLGDVNRDYNFEDSEDRRRDGGDRED